MRWKPSWARRNPRRSPGGRRTRVAVTDDAGETLMKLVEVLDDHDDVQNVYGNYELSDALMAKLARHRLAGSMSRAGLMPTTLTADANIKGTKAAMGAAAIRILGLDPGLGRMGWGVIALEGTRLSHIAHGVIATKPAIGLGLRLMALHRELTAVIARLSPAAIAVEQAFVARDPSAALKLGHARAVALLAAAQAGLEIAEYAPNHIKKCVVGAGHAGKEQVQFMVKRLLAGLRRRPGRRRRCAGRRHRACASVRHARPHHGGAR